MKFKYLDDLNILEQRINRHRKNLLMQEVDVDW